MHSTKKDTIYIISNQIPFLNAYKYDLTKKEIHIFNIICNHLTTPNDFDIDRYGQLIFSDNWSNSVLIFDQTGDLLHTIRNYFTVPMSLALESKNRVIVSCHKHCVIIF